jgi:hypothetical protein
LSPSALPAGASGLQTARSSRATVRVPGSRSPSGLSPPTSVAFVYAVLTCDNILPDRHRLHVRARRRRLPQYTIVSSADPLITDIWRTGSGHSKRSGEPLAVADGDFSIRWLTTSSWPLMRCIQRLSPTCALLPARSMIPAVGGDRAGPPPLDAVVLRGGPVPWAVPAG